MVVTLAVEAPDQPAVVALLEASDALMDALYPPEGNFAVDLATLCQPDISFVVARLGGRVAGCGAIRWFDDGSAELKRIFVHEDARGNGLGSRIMAFLHDLAGERQIGRLYLETGPLNVEAVRMYAALGYAECGPFAGYENNPYSVFMTKQLAAA